MRFLWHLVLAVDRVAPGSLPGTRELLSSAAMPLREPQVAAATLTADLCRDEITGLVLCLDDWHLVPAGTGTATFLQQLIPYLPAHVHLLVAGRSRGEGWPERWRLQGWLEEIGPEALLFTPAEAAALLRGVHGVSLPDHRVEEAVRHTGGWAMGLHLVARSLRAQPAAPGSAGLAIPPADARALGAYLDAEVMAHLPPERRAFLLDTAILEELPVALCDALRGAADAAAHLGALAADGLFTVLVDPPAAVYRYQPLFRDYLLERLRAEGGPDGLADRHRRVAELARAAGDGNAAVRHYLAAGDGPAAARLLEELAEPALWGQSADTVSAWLAQLPPDLLETRPRLLLLSADGKRWEGELDLAAALLEQARTLAAQQGDAAGLAGALAGLGHIYLLRGESAEARRLITTALASTPAPERRTRALCLVRLALVEWMEGAPDRCVPLLTEARSLFAALGDRLGEAWALHNLAVDVHVARGELREAVAVFHQVDDLCAGTRNRLRCICLLNLGSNLAYLGRFAEGRGYLQQALAMAEALAFAAGRGYALAYLGRVAAEVGDLAAAAAHLQEARAIEARITEPQLRLEVRVGEALLHRQAGRPDLAAETARQHLVWALDTKNPYYLATSWYQLVLAHAARGAAADARRALDRAEALVQGNPSPHTRFLVRMAEAFLAQALPAAAPRRLRAPLAEALALAEAQGYDGLFIAEGEWGLRLLQAAVEGGIAAGYAGHLATRWHQVRAGAAARPEAVPAAGPAPRLQIRLLGPFTAELDGAPIPAANWRGRKPRELAKLLALRLGVPVALDACLDALWPNLDREAAQRNFRVTLHWLRRALGEELVQYTGGRCLLDPHLTWCDVAEFRRLHQAAGERWRAGDTAAAAALYRQCVHLYRDDLLAQDPAGDWHLADREELREFYLGALHRLAVACARTGDLEEAMTLAQRVIALDPLREPAYRLLMQLLARRGRGSEAIRLYQVCSEHLRRELGVAPSPATRSLLERLTAGAPA